MRTYLFLCLFSAISLFTFGQNEVRLNTVQPPTASQTVKARDGIWLSPGFHAKPNQGRQFQAYIDPTLTGKEQYTDAGNGNGSSNLSINFTGFDAALSVGSIAGGTDVSPSGAATYNIPIDLAPGINGMQPSLNLVYNSQGGNGVLGLGWSLAGPSAIIRTSSSIYHDGALYGLQYNDTYDRLALDGQRLISLNANMPGVTGTNFVTEAENFAQITRSGSGNSSKFTVTTKDGKTLEYGSTADSRITYYSFGYNVYGWLLKKVTDAHGNYMEYQYNNNTNTGECYLTKISYTGNGSIAPQHRVELLYQARSDSWSVTGNKMNQSQTVLVDAIKVYDNNQLLWTYNLRYQMFNGQSVLLSVTKTTAGNASLNATEFLWEKPAAPSDASVANVSTMSPVGNNVSEMDFRGDFNGDGRMDVLHIKWNNATQTIGNLYWLYCGTDNGVALKSTGNTPRCEFLRDWPEVLDRPYAGYFPLDNSLLPSGFPDITGRVLTGDFDGDGCTEIMVFIKEYDLKENAHFLYQANPSWYMDIMSLIQARSGYSCYMGKCSSNGTIYFSMVATVPSLPDEFAFDVDGDGRTEIMIGSSVYRLENGIFTLKGTMPCSATTLRTAIWADLNGDGLSDFVLPSGETYLRQPTSPYSYTNTGYIGRSSGSTYSGSAAVLGTVDHDRDGVAEVILLDDRREEIRTYASLSDYMQVKQEYESMGFYVTLYCDPNYYNTYYGQSFYYQCDGYGNCYEYYIEDVYIHAFRQGKRISIAKAQQGIVATFGQGSLGSTAYISAVGADFNGDSRQDIALFTESSLVSIWHRNVTGNGYTVKNVNADIGKNYFMGDFTGDGNINLYSGVKGKLYTWVSGNPQTSIKSIRDGMNLQTDFTYAPLTNTSVYTRGTSVYPLVNVSAPLYVVKNITRQNGVTAIGGSAITLNLNYTYEAAKVHAEGKGLLGFGKMKVNNTTMGIVTEMQQNFHAAYGVSTRTITTEKVGTKTLSETDLTYKFTDLGSKRFLMTPDIKLEKDIDGNLTTTKYTYDTNGNLNKEEIDYGGGLTTTTTATYVRAGSHIPNLPQEVAVTQKHANDASSFTTKTYTTYNTKGYPAMVVENYHTTDKRVTKEYLEYDAYGNVVKTKTTAGSLTSVENTYTSDPTKRYVVQQSTKAGNEIQTASFTYDAAGNLTAQNGHDGLTTAYDAWGRRPSTTYPAGRTETAAISWQNSAYYQIVHTSITGQAPVTTVFDRTGRELSTETTGPGPQKMAISTTHTCDPKGRLISTASKRGTLTLTTTYAYNPTDGRLASKTAHGATTTYSYGNRQVKTARDGKESTKTYDAWGNIATTVDRNNTQVVYKYYSSGLPKEITAAGTKSSMTYDAVGNQLTLNDPNAGTTTYEYDAWGRVKKQTDGQGRVQSITYDAWGRKDEHTIGGVVTKYEYVASGNGKGQVLKVTDRGTQHYLAYVYDNAGRLTKETRHIQGTGDFETAYAYDTDGRIASVTYPGGVKESRIYDNGYLKEVLIGSASVWKIDTYTAQSIKIDLGGQFQSEATYDNATGMLTGLKTATKGTPSTFIRNFTYQFDAAKGLLNSRTGMIVTTLPAPAPDTTEVFTYDEALYRLEKVQHRQGNGVARTAMELSYKDNGNIESKTGIGTYTYPAPTASKPHAVQEIDNTAGWVPNRIQQINYTAFRKVANITDTIGGQAYYLSVQYGPDQERVKTELKKNGATIKTTIFAGNYERVTQGGVTRELYYIAGSDGLFLIYVKQAGQADKKYYVHPDHLGSLAIITDDVGNVVQRCTFDAWGKRTLIQGSLMFDRGYTGHEHIDELALVNMNGRMYDPLLGRFLSPDNYVQDPLFSQSFNRYAYAWNNPLMYTDPDGEFILGYLFGFIKGVVTLTNPFKTAWQGGVNEVKIMAGLFAADTKQSGWGWQILSRWTWQLPQTLAGYGFAQLSNYAGQVDKVDYWGGATVTSGNNWGKKAVTLGSYIIGNRDIAADPNNPLFQHEYGHYLQSQAMGWAYLPRVGIPSMMSAKSKRHDFQPFEQDANLRAFMYFNENVEEFYQTEEQYRHNRAGKIDKGWSFYENPLDTKHIGFNSRNDYYDYYDPEHRDLINSLRLQVKWYDYVSWIVPTGPIWVGLGNGIYYKKRRVK